MAKQTSRELVLERRKALSQGGKNALAVNDSMNNRVRSAADSRATRTGASTFQHEIRKMSGQSTRDYIGVKAQRNLHILLPKSHSIASKITEPLLSVSQLHVSITNQISLYKNLFSAMSQDLLSGHKRVKI